MTCFKQFNRLLFRKSNIYDIKQHKHSIHHHENDANYDNVILHVVWEHDTEVFRKDNSEIPVLEIKKYEKLYPLNF